MHAARPHRRGEPLHTSLTRGICPHPSSNKPIAPSPVPPQNVESASTFFLFSRPVGSLAGCPDCRSHRQGGRAGPAADTVLHHRLDLRPSSTGSWSPSPRVSRGLRLQKINWKIEHHTCSPQGRARLRRPRPRPCSRHRHRLAPGSSMPPASRSSATWWRRRPGCSCTKNIGRRGTCSRSCPTGPATSRASRSLASGSGTDGQRSFSSCRMCHGRSLAVVAPSALVLHYTRPSLFAHDPLFSHTPSASTHPAGHHHPTHPPLPIPIVA